MFAAHGHELDTTIAVGSTLFKWKEGLSKRLAHVADHTGEKKRGAGESQLSVVWRLKPHLVAALQQSQDEVAGALDMPTRKRRKRDTSMDYAKAFRK